MENDASWRQLPHTFASLIETILAKGEEVNPLLSAPFVCLSVFRIDWLHVADLGVGADCIGNILFMARQKMPGNNVQEKQK